jgi:hypothetical protein
MLPFWMDLTWMAVASSVSWIGLGRRRAPQQRARRALVVTFLSWVVFTTVSRAVLEAQGSPGAAFVGGAVFGLAAVGSACALRPLFARRTPARSAQRPARPETPPPAPPPMGLHAMRTAFEAGQMTEDQAERAGLFDVYPNLRPGVSPAPPPTSERGDTSAPPQTHRPLAPASQQQHIGLSLEGKLPPRRPSPASLRMIRGAFEKGSVTEAQAERVGLFEAYPELWPRRPAAPSSTPPPEPGRPPAPPHSSSEGRRPRRPLSSQELRAVPGHAARSASPPPADPAPHAATPPAPPPTQRATSTGPMPESLLRATQRALEAGEITPADLERDGVFTQFPELRQRLRPAGERQAQAAGRSPGARRSDVKAPPHIPHRLTGRTIRLLVLPVLGALLLLAWALRYQTIGTVPCRVSPCALLINRWTGTVRFVTPFHDPEVRAQLTRLGAPRQAASPPDSRPPGRPPAPQEAPLPAWMEELANSLANSLQQQSVGAGRHLQQEAGTGQ